MTLPAGEDMEVLGSFREHLVTDHSITWSLPDPTMPLVLAVFAFHRRMHRSEQLDHSHEEPLL